MVDEKTKLKDWYMKEFPEDELGSQIPDQFTFYDLYRCLDNYCDPYSLMGDSADSIMRERFFAELAVVMDVDYDYIYDQWLKTTDRPYVINEAEESTVDADKINLDNIIAQLKDSGITNESTLDLMSKDVLKDLKNNYAKDCQSDGIYYGIVIADAIKKKIDFIHSKMNESEKLTESSSIKSVEPNYTGGNIYVYTGELNDGTYFMASDDWTDTQNNFYNVLIVNEDPNSEENEEDSWFEDWQQSHLVKSLEAEEAANFFKDMLTWVIKNKPDGNYQVADIEDILDDIKG